jgi:nucleoside phosphorylase
MTEPRIDFAIITAIEVERRAVCEAFGMSDRHRIHKEARTYWCKKLNLKNGEFYEIVVAQSSDMAGISAATLTLDIIHHWHPGAILLVGIAAGIAPQQQALGDVVIGSDIYYYERGKVTPDGTKPEPYMLRPDATLWDRVQSVAEWKSPISVARPDGSQVHPRIHYGVIASGEKVIAEAAVRDQIAAGHRKIEALEMEGYGFSVAVWQNSEHIRHLVIKAICDWADSEKKDKWHPYATAVAAEFTKHFLLDRPLDPLNPPRPIPPPDKIDPAYKPIIEAFKSGTVVPFLGSGINLCDRLPIPIPIPNSQSCQQPLSEIELALWLSQVIKDTNNSLIEELMGVPCLFCHADIEERPDECPIRRKIKPKSGDSDSDVWNCPLAIQQKLDVAKMNIRFLSQHYAIHTSLYDLYNKVQQLFKDAQPNRLHRFFAELPEKMKKAGHGLPYRLIVTTNYDNLLEKAFCEAKQPFDVVFYVAEVDQPGRFKHRKFRSEIQEGKESIVPQETNFIENPNQYSELFSRDYPYPVILKMYGSLEDGDFVITEDQHFSYLLNSNFETIIPTGLLTRLKQSSLLFLGYSLNDYDLQLTLHKSWVQQTLFVGQKSSWFIHRSQPGSHEEKFWKDRHVTLYEIRLEDFLTQLERGVKQEMMQHV